MMNCSTNPAFKGTLSTWNTTGKEPKRLSRVETTDANDFKLLDRLQNYASSCGDAQLGEDKNTLRIDCGPFSGDTFLRNNPDATGKFNTDEYLVRINPETDSVTIIDDKDPKKTTHRTISKNATESGPIKSAISFLQMAYEVLAMHDKHSK